MDFIQHQSHLCFQIQCSNIPQIIKSNITQQFNSVILFYQSLQQFKINSLINQSRQISLFAAFVCQRNTFMRQYTSLIQKYLLTVSSSHSRPIIIRQFLKSNSYSKIFKNLFNPINGQFSFQVNINCIQQRLTNTQILQIFQELHHNLYQYSLLQYNKISRFLNRSIKEINYRQNTQYDIIKKMIKISPYYAWSLLKSSTHSNKINLNVYNQLRKNFIERQKKQQIINTFIQIIQKVNISNIDRPRNGQMLTQKQEKIFRFEYLPQLKGNNKAKLINQITLSQQNFNKLLKQQLCKIQCYESGKIHLVITTYPKNHVKYLNYQKQILQKLPNQQFIGLPKFYIIKNFKKQTQNCLITNLTYGISYLQYFQKNSHTVSIFSKLHLLHQIAITLKYLTSHKIVYHNLIPNNLYIRKGLYVKATDFTNAYHSQINFLNHQKIIFQRKTLLPYVSNYQYKLNMSQGDQKSDVFSFGMILFETIYGYTPLYSKKINKEEQLMSKLLKPLIISIQKGYICEDHMPQLLTYLSLQAIRHEKIKLDDKQVDDTQDKLTNINKIVNIKYRPYLDWILIILKFVIQIYKQVY